jgi:hypothetical protein
MMEIAPEHAERFSAWLREEAITSARGDHQERLPVAPEGRFWLGRLAPEVKVQASRLGDRGERLEPCEVGIRVRPNSLDGRTIPCRVRMVAWRKLAGASDDPDSDKWEKTNRVEVRLELHLPSEIGDISVAGRTEFAGALAGVGGDGLAAEVHAEIEAGKDGPQLALTVVNVSPADLENVDTNLYEVTLDADVGETLPFILDSLPDSFRYDRRVPAYGINGGVVQSGPGTFATSDASTVDTLRPDYWDPENSGALPDLAFRRLASDPVGPLRSLWEALDRWTGLMWSDDALVRRRDAEGWDLAMFEQARTEAESAQGEVARLMRGVELLEVDESPRTGVCVGESFV